MGITCKPIGKTKSIIHKMNNELEKEEKLAKIRREAKKADSKK